MNSKIKKPVCLIVDEVDGALGGSLDGSKGITQIVEFLKNCMNYVKGNKKTKSDPNNNQDDDHDDEESDSEEQEVQTKDKKKNGKKR